MNVALSDAGVILADGTAKDISLLSPAELQELQWEQERAFARRILAAPRRSPQRGEVVSAAYDTVTKILAAREGVSGSFLPMGVHPKYVRLILHLLSRQRAQGLSPRFFEIGYGCGLLLKRVSERGFPISGIEVSAAMREQARRLLGPGHDQDLLLGDFLSHDFSPPKHHSSLIYWNDVFEHVPPDEIADYLRKIHELLVPGGRLVTITPNWHMRPSDVTGNVCPPRTEAAGLHLKEYTLREVTSLLRAAGFAHVATPLFVLPSRMFLCGTGLAGCKRVFEPGLEWLPFPAAGLLCGGLGLSCTIVTKRQ